MIKNFYYRKKKGNNKIRFRSLLPLSPLPPQKSTQQAFFDLSTGPFTL